jgi:hypothetical protein
MCSRDDGCSLVVSFRPDVSVRDAAPGQVVLSAPGTTVTLKKVTPGVATALRILSSTGATEQALSRLVRETDGGAQLSGFYYRLHQWATLRLLCYSLVADGHTIATVVPMAAGFEPSFIPVEMGTRFRLSRFAYCRREGSTLLIESPLSPARTVLCGTGLALVGALAEPRSATDLCARYDNLAVETVQKFLGLLAAVDVLAVLGEGDELAEDGDPALAGWEFHDLMFHFRSRRGRHDHPVGATFRGAGTMDPLPVSTLSKI